MMFMKEQFCFPRFKGVPDFYLRLMGDYVGINYPESPSSARPGGFPKFNQPRSPEQKKAARKIAEVFVKNPELAKAFIKSNKNISMDSFRLWIQDELNEPESLS
ncbi:MAG TPA: hypothetical protein VFQ60_00245 [Patescibacteria group bacterium]|nr:hypothetical protein [Patescibacteria group bacterium]